MESVAACEEQEDEGPRRLPAQHHRVHDGPQEGEEVEGRRRERRSEGGPEDGGGLGPDPIQEEVRPRPQDEGGPGAGDGPSAPGRHAEGAQQGELEDEGVGRVATVDPQEEGQGLVHQVREERAHQEEPCVAAEDPPSPKALKEPEGETEVTQEEHDAPSPGPDKNLSVPAPTRILLSTTPLGRRYPLRLFVFDLENTLVYNEFLADLAALVGKEEEVARITRRGVDGEIDWADGFRQRARLLEGLPRSVVTAQARNLRLVPGALGFVKALHARGHRVGLVTGGPREVAEVARARFGADEMACNEFLYEDDVFTGDVLVRVAPATKGLIALQMAEGLGVDPRETVAFADGVMDRELLRAAGVALGVNSGGKLAPWVRYETRDFDDAYRWLVEERLL